MKKFLIWAVVLAATAWTGLSLGAMFFGVWVMGSGHVGSAKLIEPTGASIVDTGPSWCDSDTGVVSAPVEVVPARGTLIDDKYMNVTGTLKVSEVAVFVIAEHGVTKQGRDINLPRHYGKDQVSVSFPVEQERALRDRYHVGKRRPAMPFPDDDHMCRVHS